MNSIVNINNHELQIKEYKGQRVVTFKDVDECHERPEGTARRNFNKNKKHLIEGVDYFKVCADEIRTHKIMDVSAKTREDLTLITESGYMMLVKSFTDDLAWEVQRMLVNTYFKRKEPKSKKDRTLASVNNAVKIMMPLLQNAGCAPEIQLLTAKTIYEQAGISFPVLIKADDEYLECDKIAAKLGVYAVSGKPHGKAIAAIIRKLPISENDYTDTWESNAHWQGTVRKYNSKVYAMIQQWLSDNHYPPQIESVNAKGEVVRYKVRYYGKSAVSALQMA